MVFNCLPDEERIVTDVEADDHIHVGQLLLQDKGLQCRGCRSISAEKRSPESIFKTFLVKVLVIVGANR